MKHLFKTLTFSLVLLFIATVTFSQNFNIIDRVNDVRDIYTYNINTDGNTDLIGDADTINGAYISSPLTWKENDLIYNQIVIDYDGNTYNTVTIGKQTWLKENLKSLHYSDGTEITEVWIYNDNETNLEIYGRLYTWNGAMNYCTTEGAQGVCPVGWHIPTDTEWTELGTYLGGDNIAGGKLKSTGTDLWQLPNTGATNESNFSALPAGEYDDSHYQQLNQYAIMWSSTETSDAWCKYRYLAYNNAQLNTYNYDKNFRYSVRCLKDAESNIEEQGSIRRKIKIKPNPANKTVLIYFPEQITLPSEVNFYNISGKLLKKSFIKSNNTEIDISDLPVGIILLDIHSNEKNIIKKFIKN